MVRSPMNRYVRARTAWLRDALALVVGGVMWSQAGCAGAPKPPPLAAPKVEVQRRLDVRGKTITAFIIAGIHHELAEMRDGEVLEVAASRFLAIEPDLRTWCRMTGQQLRDMDKAEELERYYIEKAPFQAQRKKIALVISDPGLEELLSPLGMAVSAALVGAEVHLYFQGPAVHVLEKGFQPKLKGLSSLFSGFARDGMAELGHVHPQMKLKLLQELGAHLYACGPSLDYFGVDPNEFAFEGVLISEYATFLEQMLSADVAMLLQ